MPFGDGVTPFGDGVIPFGDGVKPFDDGVAPEDVGVGPLDNGVIMVDGMLRFGDGVTSLMGGAVPLCNGVELFMVAPPAPLSDGATLTGDGVLLGSRPREEEGDEASPLWLASDAAPIILSLLKWAAYIEKERKLLI